MSDFLFKEFGEISAKQWKQKIQVDLKGGDYNELLVWESNEGIKVKPFYHQDEFEALPVQKEGIATTICQSIFISDAQTANFLAKDALDRGATAIEFQANESFDIDLVLNDLNASVVHFSLGFASEAFLSDLIKKSKSQSIALNLDPIGHLAKTGNWFTSRDADIKLLETILARATENVAVIGVDAALYQNAGATIVQQIAYALAHGNEYLNLIHNSRGSNYPSIQFNFAVGGNYFFEVAKLRAFRYLWNLISRDYGLDIDPHIFVKPSLRNKTLYDYNTNMLRTTTECMSAFLGGADTISNVAYDAVYHKKNEFGERIARNQLLILQQESYFNEAASFVQGAYYIEVLTLQLAERALKLFKEIERSGGFLKQLLEGTIQRKIAESAAKEQAQFDAAEEVLLGTNLHPNPKDLIKGELELFPFVKQKPRKTILAPIIARRLSEELEKERLEAE